LGASAGHNVLKLIHLGAEVVHILLALEKMLLERRRVLRKGVDLVVSLQLPLLMVLLKAAQPFDLIGTVHKVEEGIELGFDLQICGVERVQEERVAGEEKTSQASLFIEDQFGEPICVKKDNVRAVDRACALFDTLQTVSKDQSEKGKCCNG
jgi:hypothetical protein